MLPNPQIYKVCWKAKRLRDLNAGVNQVVLDEEKSLLTVVGTMDPICVAEKLRKIKQKPVVVNIGPPKPPEAKPEKKPECCNPCLPYYNNTCDLPYYNYNTRDMVSVSTYENGGGCTIVWKSLISSLSPSCKILLFVVKTKFLMQSCFILSCNESLLLAQPTLKILLKIYNLTCRCAFTMVTETEKKTKSK